MTRWQRLERDHPIEKNQGRGITFRKGYFSVSLRSNLPAPISLVLVLPFLLMELINRREFHEDFPFSLFIGLWLLPLVFFLILTPMIRRVRQGRRPMENPVDLVFGIMVMVLVAVMWINLLADQMPCFMGVMNCD